MKHTSGPWMVDNGDSELWGVFEESTGRELLYLCELPSMNPSKPFDESKANAHLIAAAPELLEACKLMFAAWEQLLPNLKNGVVQDYELVLTKAPLACRQAISKAEGEKV